MGANGEYSEQLKTGGKLIVTPAGWKIEYYFLGPDLRYNGHSFIIGSNRVDDYIKAYKTNYEKFEELMKSLPRDGSFEMNGECGMTICVRGFQQGIHISYGRNVTFPISNREELEKVIDDYEYCKKRGEEILKLLFNN